MSLSGSILRNCLSKISSSQTGFGNDVVSFCSLEAVEVRDNWDEEQSIFVFVLKWSPGSLRVDLGCRPVDVWRNRASESGAAVALSLSLSFACILRGVAGGMEGEHPSDIYSGSESHSMDSTLY